MVKLRAWDKKGEVMVYSDRHNSLEYECDYFFEPNERGEFVCYCIEDYDDSHGYPATNTELIGEVEEFTGVKNLSDIEIYIGDVVVYAYEGKTSIGVMRKDCHLIYIEDRITKERFSFDKIVDSYTKTADVLILGDISSNPGLMNAS